MLLNANKMPLIIDNNQIKNHFVVRVVNVEKEVWVCVDDQLSKITFIDYAHEEMMVRCF